MSSSNNKTTSMRARVRQEPIPREPTAAEKRLMDQHVTAYPGLLNTAQLPPRALAEEDFSEIDPLAYRRHHPVANNNAGTFDAIDGNESNHAVASETFTARPVELMTTAQLANKMSQLGAAVRAGGDPSLSAPGRRGCATRNYNPPFDSRSTYRGDYCQDEIPPLRGDEATAAAQRDAGRTSYQADWSADERTDIAAAMKKPYLTLPESMRRGAARPTYRCDYMRDEDDATAVRLLPHTTDLAELGTTFAFSGYSVDDPRRTIRYDAAVAALEEPRSGLEQSRRARVQQQQQLLLSTSRGGAVGGAGAGGLSATSGGRTHTSRPLHNNMSSLIQKYHHRASGAAPEGGAASGKAPSAQQQRSAREELDAVRALRRESLERAREAQQQRSAAAPSAAGIADRCGSMLVVPGVKGEGHRRAPKSNQDDYIYLPQDHFRRCDVTDY